MIDKIGTKCGAELLTKSLVRHTEQVASQSGAEIKSLEFMPTKADLVKSTVGKVSENADSSNVSACISNKELSQKLEKKVASYLRIIPQNSKMRAPLKFQVAGSSFEMSVDKTRELSQVSLKETTPMGESMLIMGFDSKGRMMNGDLFINGIYERTDTLRFARSKSNARRIDYTEVYRDEDYSRTTSFLPIANSNSWSPIKESLEKNKKPHGLSPSPESGALEQLFFELVGVKKTVL